MNNPPAFPLASNWLGELRHLNGMTLRDYFAAKAMQAMEERNANGTNHSRAIRAYQIADAMLKAREQ
jgi:hypothetical protein